MLVVLRATLGFAAGLGELWLGQDVLMTERASELTSRLIRVRIVTDTLIDV